MNLSEVMKALYNTESGCQILRNTEFLPAYGSTGFPRRQEVIRRFFPEAFWAKGSEMREYLLPEKNRKTAMEKVFNRFQAPGYTHQLAEAFHRQVMNLSGTALPLFVVSFRSFLQESHYQPIVFSTVMGSAVSRWCEEEEKVIPSSEKEVFFSMLHSLLSGVGSSENRIIRHATALMHLFLFAVLGEEYLKEKEFVNFSPDPGIPVAILTNTPIELGRNHIRRPDYIEKIDEALEEHHVVVLYGLDGIGKSRLAAEYARKHRMRQKRVIYTEYADSFYETVRRIPVMVPLPPRGSKKDVSYLARLQALRQLGEEDLLVIVHVGNGTVPFVRLLREEAFRELERLSCRILLTTSRFDAAETNVMTLAVEPPDEEVLLRFMNRFYEWEPEEEAALRFLLKWFDHHTQLAELTAKTLAASVGRITAERLVEQMTGEIAGDDGYPCIAGRYRDRADETTLLRIYRQLYDVSVLPCEYRQVMAWLSILPAEGCQEELFSGLLAEAEQRNALLELIRRGWVKRRSRRRLVLAPTLRRASWDRLYDIQQDDPAAAEEFLNRLLEEAQIHKYPDTGKLTAYQEMIRMVCETPGWVRRTDEVLLAKLMERFGQLGGYTGDIQGMRTYEKRCIAIREKHCPQSRELAHAYNNLALSCNTYGEYETALAYSDKALAMYRKCVPLSDPEMLAARNNHAYILLSAGQEPLALWEALQVLALREEFQKDTEPVLHSYLDVADIWYALGEARKAHDMLVQTVLPAMKYVLGKRPHLLKASAYILLAQTKLELGFDASETVRQMDEELGRNKEIPSGNTVLLRRNYVYAQYEENQGYYQEAVRLYRRVLEQMRENGLEKNRLYQKAEERRRLILGWQ